MEVSLRVHEADTNQWNAEIAGFFAVIAGEYAKAAGIDGKRLMKRELRREVRDWPWCVGILMLPPRPARASRRLERIDRGVIDREVSLVVGRVIERFLRHGLQHQHRVVRRLPPELIIEFAKYFARLRIPRPPEIAREFGKSVELFRDD